MLDKFLLVLYYPNPDIETRIRVQSLGMYSKYKKYVVSLDEIAKNDYNLNIPRYVDTFEEEEEIQGYLKELGYE